MQAPAAEETSKEKAGFWSGIREAIRGSHIDYTQESIGRSIMLLSIPMVLEMIMESVFAVVDVFFVARLGPHGVFISISLAFSLLAVVSAAVFRRGRWKTRKV